MTTNTDYDKILWDYNLKNNSLTILYPNGYTSVTTTNPYLINQFNPPANEYLDYYLSDFAHRILARAKTPQNRLPALTYNRRRAQ